MLTRETKAGLVVGCSFICLIAVVVVARLRNGDIGPAEEQAKAEGTPTSPSGPPAPAQPVPVQTVPSFERPPDPSGFQLTQAMGTGAPAPAGDPRSNDPPPPPMPPTLLVPDDGLVKESPVSSGDPRSPVFVGPPWNPSAAEPPISVSDLVPKVDPFAPTTSVVPPKRDLVPAAPLTTGTAAPGGSRPLVDPSPVPPPAPGGATAGTNLTPPPTMPLPARSDTGPAQVEPANRPPAPEVGKPPSVPEVPLEPTPRPAPAAGEGGSGIARPAPMNQDPPAAPAPRSRPPIVPEVDSWDEDIHIWKDNDTFPVVSLFFYKTDVYARALVEFNRAHPQGAEGLRENPPVVRPGQKLFIPPIRVLTKEHPAAVPAGTETSSKHVAAPTATADESSYRVGQSGEMFLDIARRTRVEWEQIYLLNSTYDPKLPVPPGRVLRLPAGAQVPAENRP